jgi:hypothetical protein
MPMSARCQALDCDDVFVTRDEFADRLDASTYEDDDETVGVFETSPAEQDSLWLFHRLTGVAAAYELHTLPMLGGSEPVRLDRLRCESLLDELAFVADRLNDPLAVKTAQVIADYVAIRTRRPAWAGQVTFEGD